MNNVSIIGRLGQDPELRTPAPDKTVTSFSLAIDTHRKDEPTWITVEVWNKLGEVVAEHKSKGDQVAVTGRLTSSQWTTDDGEKRSRVVVTADTVDFLHNANQREEATV